MNAASSPPLKRFASYTTVGIIGFIVDAGILSALVHVWQWPHYTARAVSFSAAVTVTWALNRRWVFARTQDVGEAKESVPVQFSGEPLEIGFNAEFLREGIESIGADDLRLKLISPLRPAVIEGADEDPTYLIMPIRLPG